MARRDSLTAAIASAATQVKDENDKRLKSREWRDAIKQVLASRFPGSELSHADFLHHVSVDGLRDLHLLALTASSTESWLSLASGETSRR